MEIAFPDDASLMETFNSPTVPSRRRLYSGHSMRTVLMSPKSWRPSPMPARSVEGAPSTIFSAVFISSKWTHSICLVAKFTGRSPIYTPASSQTPPKPSSRPRSVSKPSDRRIPRSRATVRVIKPFSLLTVSVCVGTVPLRTSFSRSNPYRPGGMLRFSSGLPVLFQENFSSRSMLYHPAAKVIDRRLWRGAHRGCQCTAGGGPPPPFERSKACGTYRPNMNLKAFKFNSEAKNQPGLQKAAARGVGNLAEGRVQG